jgi:formylglycine-generating enzyme required for sulfatase activity
VLLTLDPSVFIDLVRIPAGEFLMGSDPSVDIFAQPDELPQHHVFVSEFFMGRYPVTNAQYAVFAQMQGMPFGYADGKKDHPVVRVSWEEAVSFCAWASHVTGRHVRLPSEAEWEKSARGIDGRLYPWGNNWDPSALNTAEQGPSDVTPVDMYSPAGDSPYGIADMAGNVWEWIADWFADNSYDEAIRSGLPVNDPVGAESGSHRVLRGACHFFRQSGTRAARRFKYNQRFRCYDIGFRVAASLSG